MNCDPNTHFDNSIVDEDTNEKKYAKRVVNACANDDEAHWTSREWTKRMFWRSFSTVKSRSCESQSKCIQRDRQKRTSETSRKDVSWFGKRNENRKRTSTHQRTLHPKCDATNWSDGDECAQMADHVEQHRRWTTDGKERIAEIVWRFCCSFCFWSFAISLIRSLALARFFIIFNAWNVCVCARSFFWQRCAWTITQSSAKEVNSIENTDGFVNCVSFSLAWPAHDCLGVCFPFILCLGENWNNCMLLKPKMCTHNAPILTLTIPTILFVLLLRLSLISNWK